MQRMGKRNFLNLDARDLKKPIFRVVSCKRFLAMLSSRSNGLVRPRMWDDPFENFILYGRAKDSSGNEAIFGYRDDLYGQCWSFHVETDAMWRIYAPHKEGVKIKTWIDRFFDSLFTHGGKYKDISCFIGKVQYLSQKGITKAARRADPVDPSGVGIAKTLLLKRKAFSPEREVRLIYFNQNKSFHGDVFEYPIDLNTLFDEVVLDPRMSDQQVSRWKKKFILAGFTGKLKQSRLYRPPRIIVIKIP